MINASPPRVEVLTSVQRRRHWPTAETPFDSAVDDDGHLTSF